MEQQSLTAMPGSALRGSGAVPAPTVSSATGPASGYAGAATPATASWLALLPADLQVHPKIQAMGLEELVRAFLAGPQGHTCDASSPADYQFQKPFGADWYDETMGETMKQLMFAVGLSREQARALHDAFIMLAQAAMEEEFAQAEIEAETINDEILAIWGPRFEQKQQAARAAARFIGLTADELQALSGEVDSLRLLDALARIGEALDEDSFAAGQAGGGITPEQAKNELARLSADKQHLAAFMNPAHPEHAKVKALRSQLAQIASLAPDASAKAGQVQGAQIPGSARLAFSVGA